MVSSSKLCTEAWFRVWMLCRYNRWCWTQTTRMVQVYSILMLIFQLLQRV